ncbi:hypothetical protein I5677_01995 [Mobilitalea sibirica]|uniref:Uncharacterized protein n=1 Tax=Mobilitalea sibirica TaxID=1462919 RepID=A0A8J7KZ89_9FIRM|nr:hypothetical protein [Mobilitalea sibirica]MBH1939663.1 hypothetical protein [Mobilitalea sibirica]
MGLLEYLLERKNPGKMGEFQKNNQPVKKVHGVIVLIKLIASILFIYFLFNMFVRSNLNLQNVIVFVLILFIYCLISYKVIPRPDPSNVGLIGGLIDHPFRYTDDVNRLLILFLFLLYPGRFVSTTIFQTILLFKRAGKN